MQNGLYKVEIDSAQGSGRGVMVVRDGHLFGGNAAFAVAGRFIESGSDIAVEISTLQRNDNSGFKPVPGAENITLGGRREGDRYLFEAGSALLAGAPRGSFNLASAFRGNCVSSVCGSAGATCRRRPFGW